MEDSKVAVLLEDLRAKFQVFGEGVEALRVEVRQNAEQNRQEHQLMMQMFEQNRREHLQMIEQNRQEHQQMMQTIQELNKDFQIELKRVK